MAKPSELFSNRVRYFWSLAMLLCTIASFVPVAFGLMGLADIRSSAAGNGSSLEPNVYPMVLFGLTIGLALPIYQIKAVLFRSISAALWVEYFYWISAIVSAIALLVAVVEQLIKSGTVVLFVFALVAGFSFICSCLAYTMHRHARRLKTDV